METKLTKEEQSEIKQNRERGASMVEYAILTALVVAIAVAALAPNGPLAQSLNNLFDRTAADLDAVNP